MATIRFYPYSKKGKCKIYLRLSVKRGFDFRLSTTQTIEDSSTWNYRTNYPKKNSETNKNLHSTLQNLEKNIENEILLLEQSSSESINSINGKWLKEIILSFFNETPVTDRELLIPYSNGFVKDLNNKTYQRNGKLHRYSENTISKYLNFTKQLKGFQDYIGKDLKIIDVNSDFAISFINYLTDVKELSINTKGRFLKRLKTIVKDAEINGRIINPQYKLIKGFEDENVVTFLTFEEIDQIIETPMPTKSLELAKDWIVIGCFTAARISDLFRMNKSMIIKERGVSYISLKQFKTNKKVMIPIHYKVEDVLKKYEGNFPPNIYKSEKSHRTQLSSLMKQVCKITGLNVVVRGRLNGVIGYYPKYKLISNHTCRRSFASNFYGLEGWTTPMVMEITGHENEKNFYKYIDKDNFYLSERAAANFAKMKEKDLKEKKKLRVLKNVSNK